jgi:hypothetical protein
LLLELIDTFKGTEAGPLKVTVAVASIPPTTDEGLMLSRIISTLGAKLSSTDRSMLPGVEAMMVTGVREVTALVETVMLTTDDRADTVTRFGNCNALELAASDTFLPSLSASPFNTTVTVALIPPCRVAGYTLTDNKASNGVTVSSPDRSALPVIALVTKT